MDEHPPAFILVLSPDIMQIHPAFTRQIRGDLPEKIHLRDKFKNLWQVKLTQVENDFYLQDGLISFCEANSLEQGDFIFFQYLNQGLFEVKIFDASLIETKGAGGLINTNRVEQQVDVHEEKENGEEEENKESEQAEHVEMKIVKEEDVESEEFEDDGADLREIDSEEFYRQVNEHELQRKDYDVPEEREHMEMESVKNKESEEIEEHEDEGHDFEDVDDFIHQRTLQQPREKITCDGTFLFHKEKSSCKKKNEGSDHLMNDGEQTGEELTPLQNACEQQKKVVRRVRLCRKRKIAETHDTGPCTSKHMDNKDEDSEDSGYDSEDTFMDKRKIADIHDTGPCTSKHMDDEDSEDSGYDSEDTFMDEADTDSEDSDYEMNEDEEDGEEFYQVGKKSGQQKIEGPMHGVKSQCNKRIVDIHNKEPPPLKHVKKEPKETEELNDGNRDPMNDSEGDDHHIDESRKESKPKKKCTNGKESKPKKKCTNGEESKPKKKCTNGGAVKKKDRYVLPFHDIYGMELFESGIATRPKNPYFLTHLSRRKGSLYIPKHVAMNNNLDLPPELLVFDENRRSWKLRKKLWHDGRVYYSKGWTSLCKLNDVKPEDVLICELIKTSSGILNAQLTIIRANQLSRD